MNNSKESVQSMVNLAAPEKPLGSDNKTDVPLLPEHCDPDFLKLTSVYEKRIFQTHPELDFRNIISRVKMDSKEELLSSISSLERETNVEIQTLLEHKARQEAAAQQTLDALNKEIEKSEIERQQQQRILVDLEDKLRQDSREYELKDTIDQELDELAVAVEMLGATFQSETSVARINTILFGQIIFSSSAHFGKHANTLYGLFLDAEKQEWGLLLNKQVAKSQEGEECPEETVQEFKELLGKAGLQCSEKQDALMRNCVEKANHLRRFAIVRYPGFPARARAHNEKKIKPRGDHPKGQSWVQGGIRKFKKLTENRHSVYE